MISNIKELKEFIKDLPDDMQVVGYDGRVTDKSVSLWVSNPKEWSSRDPKYLTISVD